MQQLEEIINWAGSSPDIRALMLSGSLAQKGKKDALSDYDIAVYGTEFLFIENDEWLKNIRNYWVCIHDKFSFLGYEIPTRLTIFDAYFKVDFSFHPVELLMKIIDSKTLPDDYNIGYEILLDKDDLLNKLPKPTYKGFVLLKPDKQTFQRNVNEFWFECYHEAKYLYRDDLWTAKLRDHTAKELLREMLEWHEAAKRSWNFSPKNCGKEMYSWLDKTIWHELQNCFDKFDVQDNLKALYHSTQLYRKIATETANLLHYEYDQKLDDHISAFSEKIFDI